MFLVIHYSAACPLSRWYPFSAVTLLRALPPLAQQVTDCSIPVHLIPFPSLRLHPSYPRHTCRISLYCKKFVLFYVFRYVFSTVHSLLAWTLVRRSHHVSLLSCGMRCCVLACSRSVSADFHRSKGQRGSFTLLYCTGALLYIAPFRVQSQPRG